MASVLAHLMKVGSERTHAGRITEGGRGMTEDGSKWWHLLTVGVRPEWHKS